MKNIFLLMLAIVFTSVSACSNTEDSTTDVVETTTTDSTEVVNDSIPPSPTNDTIGE
jgi:ABC-type Fe3+-hydroxamate transport system substrate-binding protein